MLILILRNIFMLMLTWRTGWWKQWVC